MGDDRLSGLALIAIKSQQFAGGVDYNEIIDSFARVQSRRKGLL